MSAARSDWRDTVRVAGDVALLGILMTVAALPVVTAGAAVATGSAALHHHLGHDRWPGPAALWRIFHRGLLPGAAATLTATALVVLFVADLLALRRGVVPGGSPLIALTAALAVAAAGFAALTVVAIGTRDGYGWRAAVRSAAATAVDRPGTLASSGGVVALAGILGLLVHPALTPVMFGFALFAVHAVVRYGRRGPGTSEPAAPTAPAAPGRAARPGPAASTSLERQCCSDTPKTALPFHRSAPVEHRGAQVTPVPGSARRPARSVGNRHR